MNKVDLIYTIFSIIISIIFSIFVFDIKDPKKIIVLSIFSFILVFVWYKFIILIVKKQKITKETDEIIHPVTQSELILHMCNIQKHYGKSYDSKKLERCNCGSTIFRIYKEDTEKGINFQTICLKCNKKVAKYIYI